MLKLKWNAELVGISVQPNVIRASCPATCRKSNQLNVIRASCPAISEKSDRLNVIRASCPAPQSQPDHLKKMTSPPAVLPSLLFSSSAFHNLNLKQTKMVWLHWIGKSLKASYWDQLKTRYYTPTSADIIKS